MSNMNLDPHLKPRKGALTPFGIECRRIRKDKGLFMGDVCDRIGVTPGFLSQVETGSKAIPEDLVGKLTSALDLPKAEAEILEEAAALSARDFRIRLDRHAGYDDRRLARAIEIGFAKLSDSKKARLYKLLKEDNGNG